MRDVADAAAVLQAFGTDNASRWRRLLCRIARWAPFGIKVIWSRDGLSPYLLRVNLVPRIGMLPALFLHYFFRGDDDVEHHNHPWFWSCSLILAGGYIEERLTDEGVIRRHVKPGRLNIIRQNDFHRVRVFGSRPWTLFLAGKRCELPEEEAWGFKHPASQQYTPWRKHVDQLRAGLGKEHG